MSKIKYHLTFFFINNGETDAEWLPKATEKIPCHSRVRAQVGELHSQSATQITTSDPSQSQWDFAANKENGPTTLLL